jgi:hypothetical protein
VGDQFHIFVPTSRIAVFGGLLCISKPLADVFCLHAGWASCLIRLQPLHGFSYLLVRGDGVIDGVWGHQGGDGLAGGRQGFRCVEVCELHGDSLQILSRRFGRTVIPSLEDLVGSFCVDLLVQGGILIEECHYSCPSFLCASFPVVFDSRVNGSSEAPGFSSIMLWVAAQGAPCIDEPEGCI